jgi:hypothetical protein
MRIIGIDPGTHTGVAIYENGILQQLQTIAPWDFKCDVLEILKPDLVVLEDSTEQSHVFTAGKGAVGLKIARNIGEIDAWCKLIKAECGNAGIAYHAISPKNKGAKMAAAAFNLLSGWDGSSNQHERDAACVAWPYRSARKA